MASPRCRLVRRPSSLVFLLTASCGNCDEVETYLLVWPDTVQVQTSGLVPLQAMLVDEHGFATVAEIHWGSADVSLAPTSGPTTNANVVAGVSREIKVTASGGGHTATAVLLADPALDIVDDVALEPLPLPPPPPPVADPRDALYLAIASGHSGIWCKLDRATAFVGSLALMGRFGDSFGCTDEGFVLAPSLSPTLAFPMSWTDQRDALPNGAVGLPIVLNLRFWMEPGEMQPAQVQAIAAQQLAKTNQLFWENRVGVELYDLPFDSMVGAASPCFLSWNIPSPVKPGVLNVYFVHLGITAPHGMYCVSLSGSVLTHHDAILFNLDRSDPSTLAHEVSHAFGLLFPSWGHPYSVEGILSTNLMLGNLTGLSRGHLSVGQVLRMHLDKESYLSRRAGTGTACQHDGSRNPCPALGLDLYSKSPVTP